MFWSPGKLTRHSRVDACPRLLGRIVGSHDGEAAAIETIAFMTHEPGGRRKQLDDVELPPSGSKRPTSAWFDWSNYQCSEGQPEITSSLEAECT